MITYKSSDETVATVDADGVVTVLKPGETTITASIAETDKYAADSVSYVFTVEKADQTIVFDTAVPETLKYKTDLTYSNVATASSKVTYKSSDDTVATVDNNGKITAIGTGTTTITVMTSNNKKVTATICITLLDSKLI